MALFRRSFLYSPSLSHQLVKLACGPSFSTQIMAAAAAKPTETTTLPVSDPNTIKFSIASHPYDIQRKTSPPLNIQESTYFAIIGLLGKQFKLTKVLTCVLFYLKLCFVSFRMMFL
jgi:hypothetical protein